MDTSRIEDLLEQLIAKQDVIITRVQCLEYSIVQGASDTNSFLSDSQSFSAQIFEELKWWGDGHSLAKQVLWRLDGIEEAIASAEAAIQDR